MLGFGFSIGAQVLIARRNGAQEYKRIGPVFLQGTFFFLLLLAALLFTFSHLLFAFLPAQTDRFRWSLPSYDGVCGLACLWLFLLLCGRYVQGFLCRYYKNKDLDHKFGCDGVDQCDAELCLDIRKVWITGIGNCRSGDRFIGLGGCFGTVLHPLYVEESRL